MKACRRGHMILNLFNWTIFSLFCLPSANDQPPAGPSTNIEKKCLRGERFFGGKRKKEGKKNKKYALLFFRRYPFDDLYSCSLILLLKTFNFPIVGVLQFQFQFQSLSGYALYSLLLIINSFQLLSTKKLTIFVFEKKKKLSMELLFWVLGLLTEPFVALVLLLGIIVMLDLAGKPSTEEKENLDKKNGAEEAKLDDEGRKVGATKNSKKKKRVRKANDVEVSVKPVKDFKLSENVSEKVGFLAHLSEGRLVVDRGEGSKIMEDAGDVVVRKVDHFEGSSKSTQVLELFEDKSEIVGFLDGPLKERLDFTRDEGSNIVMEVHQFEAIGVDKEFEVSICGEKSAGECGDVNVIKDSKGAGAGAGGEGSKNIGLQAGALDRGVAHQNNELAIISDYCCVKGEDVLISGLKGFVVERGIKIDAVGGEDGLTSINDDVRVEECDSAAAERMANNTEPFEKESDTKAFDGDNRLELIHDDALIDGSDSAIRDRENDGTELKEELLESEIADGENVVVLMNEAVVIDESDTVVGERVADSGEILEEKLDTEAVDRDDGTTLINGVDQIDECDAAAGEKVFGKVKLSEGDLEREVVGEKSEDAAAVLHKVDGGEECSIHLGRSGLENLVVEEVIKSEESCSQSKVELVSGGLAYPQIEVGRVGNDNVDDHTGIREGFNGVNEGGECIVRDKDVGDNVDNNYDDDWEGVERSELEKVFAEAVNYEYGRKTRDGQLRDVQMLLYGLHKLAVEGPCHVPPPMALKVSARAKWNAWQNLGSMSPEAAMEEYIKVLSDADPGWKQLSSAEDGRHGSLDPKVERDAGNQK